MDTSELAKMVDDFLNETAPMVQFHSEIDWKESDGLYPLLIRAVMVRQHEHLRSMLALMGSQFGFTAVAMLRPACEELIWLRYLKTLTQAQANDLLRAKSRLEVADALTMQKESSGLEGVIALGLSHLDVDKLREAAESTLATLAGELKWRLSGKSKMPSVAFIARMADSSELYKFMYFATSKFVHFSPHELTRRCWGSMGRMSIGSNAFADYWSVFALRWELQLYAETLIEVLPMVGEESGPQLDDNRMLEIADRIREFGKVPIITAEELKWP